MSTKHLLLTVLATGTVVLALVFGSQLAGGSAQARPPAQQPVPPGARPEHGRGVTIPYPGRLADAAGQAAPDGAYDFTFTLYDAETGGALLWSEVQTGVAVQGGAFQVQLGGVTPLPQEALADVLWLAVAVRGPGEADFTALAPRQRVSAAPTAPDSASASPTCPHDHLGESWVGDSGAQIDGLYVRNTKTGGTGIAGVSNTGDGVVGETGASNKSGVYGNNTGSGHGVTGRSTGGPGVWGETSSGDGADAGVYGYAPNGYAIGVYGYTTSPNGWAGMFGSPNGNGVAINVGIGKTGLVVSGGGTKSAAVQTDEGSRLLYSEESTQVWFSDYDFGALEDGVAVIRIDPLFAQTVNLQEPYHVFLQAYGDAELYVTDRTAIQFQVRLREGDPNVEFSYRIVAKRLGYEEHRLEPAPWTDDDGK